MSVVSSFFPFLFVVKWDGNWWGGNLKVTDVTLEYSHIVNDKCEANKE